MAKKFLALRPVYGVQCFIGAAASAKANGNAAEAIALVKMAFIQAPTAQIVLELADYPMAAGRKGAACNTLQRWLEELRTDVDARLAPAI